MFSAFAEINLGSALSIKASAIFEEYVSIRKNAYVSASVSIGPHSNFLSSMSVRGAVSFGSIVSVRTLAQLGGALSSSEFTFFRDMYNGGSACSNGQVSVAGFAILGSSLSVHEDTVIRGFLTVRNITNLGSSVSAIGTDVTAFSDVLSEKNVAIDSSLTISGSKLML